MKISKTYTANVYVGLRGGYTDFYHTSADAATVIKEFCIERQTGVTVTPTHFYYVNGDEPGLIIGFISYPRFPKSNDKIKLDALELARRLKVKLHQERVSIVLPDETIMLEDSENNVTFKIDEEAIRKRN